MPQFAESVIVSAPHPLALDESDELVPVDELCEAVLPLDEDDEVDAPPPPLPRG